MPTISKKNWTLMVYLAGDNNLDGAGINDLEEMKTAGFDYRHQRHRPVRPPGRQPQHQPLLPAQGWGADRRRCRQPGRDQLRRSSNAAGLHRVGSAGVPGQPLSLVIWNHGAGWDDADLPRG